MGVELNEQQAATASHISEGTFWARLVLKRNDGLSVVADGEHYRIGPENAEGMRGYGGAKWRVQFLDGREVETSNLWHQGTVPEQYRRYLPDNAVLISLCEPSPIDDLL